MTNDKTPTLEVSWKPIWYSRYLRGTVLAGAVPGFGKIYMHSVSGQIRIYTGTNLDKVTVSVNGTLKRMRARGRFGRLYISE